MNRSSGQNIRPDAPQKLPHMKKLLQLFTLTALSSASSFAQTATNKLDSTGDVGIGTLSPLTKLEVKGTIFSSSQANNAGVYLSGDDGSYGLIQATNNYNSLPKNLFLQKYGGNVGIGTTSAPLALSVGTPYTNDGVRIGGGTYYLDIMANMNEVSYHPLVHQNDIGIIFKGGSLGNSGGFVLAPWANAVGGLRMNNTGRIGIGTDPTAMLTFRAPATVTNDLSDASSYAIYVRPDYNNGDLASQGIAFGGNNTQWNHVSASIYHEQQGWPSYGDLVFATRPNGGSLAERLRINSAGYVGIGTSSPSSPLTVNNSQNGSYVPVAEFYAASNTTTGNASQIRFGQSGSANNAAEWRFVYDGNSSSSNRTDFGYWGNATPVLSYLANGNVGIGTVHPQSRLSVNGTITTTKLTVTQTGWADYVFNDNYRLPSLREVEAYIKKYGHLEGIASAKEVEKNGLDVGENQAALLKKVEEMTLYMIQMKKQIDEQQKRIVDLEKQLSSK